MMTQTAALAEEVTVEDVIVAEDGSPFALCPACDHVRRAVPGDQPEGPEFVLSQHRFWNVYQGEMRQCSGSGKSGRLVP
jgi:hypothetical protein